MGRDQNLILKMDVLEMEARLDMLEKRLLDAQAERKKTEDRFRRCEREVAELESVKIEDDRQTAQLNKLVEGLEKTLESFKHRAEEAEQMADHNLNLFRRKQQELEEVETKLKDSSEVLEKEKKKSK